MRHRTNYWPLAVVGIVGIAAYLIANDKGEWVLGAFLMLLLFLGG